MQKVFRVTVDISKKIPAPAFEVNTNDLKSVKLEITITNGQSLLDLTDVTPRINIRKPDNEVIFQDCEIVDAKAGKVEIILENQAYLVPGTHTAEIACYKGNEITAITGTFSYKSVKGIMNDEAVESKSEFTAINRTLNEAERILEDLRENGAGAGVDQQARQKIEEVTTRLEKTSSGVNEISLGERFDIRSKGRKRRTIVTFTDDDCRADVYTKLKPVVDQTGIKMSIACPVSNIGKANFLTLGQLQELYRNGWEISSHGRDERTKWDVATEKEMTDDSVEALNKFREWGINDVFVHTYVEGRNSKTARNVASKYFRAAVTTKQKINTIPYESYLLGRVGLFDSTGSTSEITGLQTNTMEHYKAMVDKAAQDGGWLIFMSHCWYQTFNAAQLTELINYVKSKNIEIVGMNEAINTTGNIIEVGDYDKDNEMFLNSKFFVVDNEGNVNSSMNRIKVQPKDTISASTLPKDLKLEEVSHTAITKAGFPDVGGVVVTSTLGVWGGKNYRNWQYCYQTFISRMSDKMYIRKANADGEGWGAFKELTGGTQTNGTDGDSQDNEVIEARQGAASLGENIQGIKDTLKYDIKNLVQNPNFANGITGWSVNNSGGRTIENNTLNSFLGTSSTFSYIYQTVSNLTQGSKVYAKVKVKVPHDYPVTLRLTLDTAVVMEIKNPVKDRWYTLSGVFTLGTQSSIRLYQLYSTGVPTGLPNGVSVQMNAPLLVDISNKFKGWSPQELDKFFDGMSDQYLISNATNNSVVNSLKEVNKEPATLNPLLLKHGMKAIAIQAIPNDTDNIPPNVLKGIEQSALAGFHGVEIDTRNTLDNEVVLWHDETITINGATKKVKEFTLAEIKTYDIVGGYKIPTLDEALDLCHRKGLIVFIDLKDDTVKDLELLEAKIKESGLLNSVVVASMNVNSSKYLKSINPALWIAHKFIISNTTADQNIAEAKSIGRNVMLQPEYSADLVTHLTPERIKKYHREGYLTNGYDYIMTRDIDDI